jgi:hypothetical protein
MEDDKVGLDIVMAGLVPAIHVLVGLYKDVDARHKLAAGPATAGDSAPARVNARFARLAGHDHYRGHFLLGAAVLSDGSAAGGDAGLSRRSILAPARNFSTSAACARCAT